MVDFDDNEEYFRHKFLNFFTAEILFVVVKINHRKNTSFFCITYFIIFSQKNQVEICKNLPLILFPEKHTIISGDDKMNKEIPVPDPFSKEYEYFFPSASWNDNEIMPVIAENASENDSFSIFPPVTEIDVKIPEQ